MLACRYTPGQKFAYYWQHLGIKLRVEIGAQEMAKSCCTLRVSTVAGQVVYRLWWGVAYRLWCGVVGRYTHARTQACVNVCMYAMCA